MEAAVEDGNAEEDGKEDEEDAGMKVDSSGLGNSPSRKVLPAWQGRTITIVYHFY
jgi:hypothetical protein